MSFESMNDVVAKLAKVEICLYDKEIMAKVIKISDRDQNGKFNFEEFLRIVTALKVALELQDDY